MTQEQKNLILQIMGQKEKKDKAKTKPVNPLSFEQVCGLCYGKKIMERIKSKLN